MSFGWLKVDKRQAGILADRYLDVLLGDLSGLVLLLGQAPLIALGAAGVWSNANKDTLTLYFVLCLSAFFLGAANSCREIVKERELFLRERMFNLNVGAYLLSKYRIQLILAILQSLILAGIVASFVPLEVHVAWVTTCLLVMSVCGISVGLLVSCFVKSPDKAVAMVPIIVIPQILFSDVVLGEDRLSNWTGTAQDLMPVHWGYEAMKEFRATDTEVVPLVWAALVVVGISFAAYALSAIKLSRTRY